MAEGVFVLEYFTLVAAGVTVLTALAGIALSMTLFLKLGRQPSRTGSTAGSAGPKPTQLAVLKDSIIWVQALRSGKGIRSGRGLRAWNGTASDPPAK